MDSFQQAAFARCPFNNFFTRMMKKQDEYVISEDEDEEGIFNII
jgi:hypothetical protein